MALTKTALDKLLQEADPSTTVVVRFTTQWCEASPEIEASFQRLSQTKSAHATAQFIDADVGEYPEIAAAYGIESTPTFQIFKQGVKQDSFVGAEDDVLRLHLRMVG